MGIPIQDNIFILKCDPCWPPSMANFIFMYIANKKSTVIIIFIFFIQGRFWEVHSSIILIYLYLYLSYTCIFYHYCWPPDTHLSSIIDLICISQNATVPYPTMLHSEQKCAHFCSEWSIVGYGADAFWDLWNWSIASVVATLCDSAVSQFLASWSLIFCLFPIMHQAKPNQVTRQFPIFLSLISERLMPGPSFPIFQYSNRW